MGRPAGPSRRAVADTTAVGTFDHERFQRDLTAEPAREALRDAIKKARYRDIGRFPTLLLRRSNGHGSILVGYRPYGALLDALTGIAPALEGVRIATDVVSYVAAWDRVVSREVAEALDLDLDAAMQSLNAAISDGLLVSESIRPDRRLAYYRVQR